MSIRRLASDALMRNMAIRRLVIKMVHDAIRRLGSWVARYSQRQTCKVCGHRDKFDFTITDEVWAAVLQIAKGRRR